MSRVNRPSWAEVPSRYEVATSTSDSRRDLLSQETRSHVRTMSCIQPFHTPRAKPTRKAAEVTGSMLANVEAWLAACCPCEKTL